MECTQVWYQFYVKHPVSQTDRTLQIELMDTVLSLLEVVSYLIFFTFLEYLK